MTTLMRKLLVAGLIASLAAPVSAQEYSDPRGFRLKRTPTDHRDAGASAAPEETLMRTARCVAKDRPEQVRAYLASVPGSPEEAGTFTEIEKKVSRCMPEMDMSKVGNATRAHGRMTMRLDHSSMRGALAESMLLEDETEISPAVLTLGDDGMFVAEQFHGARSAENERVFALGFAGCVMGHNPTAMQGLFVSKPGSADEKAAIVAMAPSFGQCVMEGHQVKVSASTLRNHLAETVYYAINSGKAR